jgi:hypothetical protein
MKQHMLNFSKKLKGAGTEFLVFLIIVIYLCLVVPAVHFDLW